MRFMGEVLSEGGAAQRLRQSLCRSRVFVLRDKFGEALGDIGLRISPKNPHEADVGYAPLPQAQGKGYASEALPGGLRVWFHHPGGAGHQCLGAG